MFDISPEGAQLIVRGVSRTIGVPIMIPFYHQLEAVDVAVAMATEEFAKANDESFN